MVNENSLTLLTEIAARQKLGGLLSQPQRVSGGFMHRMYRLDTEKGSYALKLLNPVIMQRPEARDHYRNAEKLERQLQGAGLPVVASLEFDGEKMQEWKGRYFYLFPWVEAKALTPAEITPAHCAVMGDLLAIQHALPCEGLPQETNPLDLDWEGLLVQAERRKTPEIEAMLRRHLSLLVGLKEKNVQSLKRLSRKVCISNGDMDCKNVLWQDGKPLIIDLECLDYGHPEREMLMLALTWAGWETDRWKAENLLSFVQAYTLRLGKPENDWLTLFDSLDTWEEWLEYNIKRAIGMEAQDDEERLLGLRQAEFAMARLLYSETIKTDVISVLEKM